MSLRIEQTIRLRPAAGNPKRQILKIRILDTEDADDTEKVELVAEKVRFWTQSRDD